MNMPLSPNAFREFPGFAGALSIRLRMSWNVAENSNPNGVEHQSPGLAQRQPRVIARRCPPTPTGLWPGAIALDAARVMIVKTARIACLLLVWGWMGLGPWDLRGAVPATAYGTSYQVNVDANGQNILGDAANEPSLCIDPTNPNRIAVGWRQFNHVGDAFREAGWAYSTNGGLNWAFPGVLEPGTFRSDPVLAADADGSLYYLGVQTNAVYYFCDLWRSTNGGASWQSLGLALGGDKPWMTIDATSGPGRGNIYETWSPFHNFTNDSNQIFSRSIDGGLSWMQPILMPNQPYFGTAAVGPNGELYTVGTDGTTFWVNRATNAANRRTAVVFDLTAEANLGGPLVYGAAVNPVGLLGQPWVAVDQSGGPTRGNVYVLCTVTNDPGNLANVMFARSTNGGRTWSAPVRINDDSSTQNAWHWFGTLAVAPNGRIDTCWNDTRHSPDGTHSELYYSWSEDGGRNWAPNRPLSPPFDHTLGYPMQEKMGDYIGMVSLNEGACIAYTATFNGEEDVYFVRAELPIRAKVALVDGVTRISWNAVPGGNYSVQAKPDLALPWSAATNLVTLSSTGSVAAVDDPSSTSGSERFYRVVRQP